MTDVKALQALANHYLAESVALREQVIRLQIELDDIKEQSNETTAD